MAAVDPVEPGHGNPVFTIERFEGFMGADETGFPVNLRQARIFDPAQVFPGGVLGVGPGSETTEGEWTTMAVKVPGR